MIKKLALIFTLFIINQAPLFANSPALQPEDAKYAQAREQMVAKLKSEGILNQDVLKAMGKVQRHEFAPQKYKDRAYEPISLPLGKLTTISSPYMVALMTEAIRPTTDMKVLEIGTASGYSAAVLGEVVNQVYTIEIIADLAKSADERLKQLGYNNIHVKDGDGFYGWPSVAPFDAIIVTCEAEKVPPLLAEQLKEGGRLIMPLGTDYSPQTLVVVTKKNGQLVSRPLVEVQFVPMTGDIKK